MSLPDAPVASWPRSLALGMALCWAGLACAQVPAWTDATPYEGAVTLHFTAPGKTARTVHGTGSARWIAEGSGATRLELRADESRTNTRSVIVFAGRAEGAHWRSAPGEVSLAVAPDGRITGGGRDTTLGRELSFAGVMHPATLRLQTRTTLDRAEGGLPAGTAIEATYDLQRDAPGARKPDCTTHGMAIVPSRATFSPPQGTCP